MATSMGPELSRPQSRHRRPYRSQIVCGELLIVAVVVGGTETGKLYARTTSNYLMNKGTEAACTTRVYPISEGQFYSLCLCLAPPILLLHLFNTTSAAHHVEPTIEFRLRRVRFIAPLLLVFTSLTAPRDFHEENPWQKLTRRIKEEPLIPFGMGLTVYALIAASRSMKAGDHHRTNRMFRARILAQGFTLAAMVAGSIYWKSDRQKRKEFDDTVKQRKADEKRDMWIKELEARDVEEKSIRAEKERRMRRLAGRREDEPAAKHPVLEEKADPNNIPSAQGEKTGTMDAVKDLLSGKK